LMIVFNITGQVDNYEGVYILEILFNIYIWGARIYTRKVFMIVL